MMIRTATVFGAAVASLAVPASRAHADYTGLSVELYTTATFDGVDHSVFRVYANFDNPGDRLVAGFGSTNYGPSIIQTRNASDTAPGDPLYNSPINGVTAPTQSHINLDFRTQYDSFVTLGVSVADQSPYGDMTFLTPGFLPLAGNNLTMSDQAWFTFPTWDHDATPGTPDIVPPQSLAGWDGDGDAPLRVMLMQLTVPAGNNVRGVLNIDVYAPLGTGGATIVQHQPFQTFNTFTVPAPSALALLGFVALARSNRRRRER